MPKARREVYVVEVDLKPVDTRLKHKDALTEASKRYANMELAVCVTYVPITVLDAALERVAELEHKLSGQSG